MTIAQLDSVATLRTDREGLWQALMELASLGATPKGASIARPSPSWIARPATCSFAGAGTRA